jgi:predicted RNase H-like HicB family nuclease
MSEVINVIYHQEPEGWWAESPQVAGWTCVGKTLDEARDLAIEGIRELVGKDMIITEIGPFVDPGTSAFGVVGGRTVESFGLATLEFSLTTVPVVPNSSRAAAQLDINDNSMFQLKG